LTAFRQPERRIEGEVMMSIVQGREGGQPAWPDPAGSDPAGSAPGRDRALVAGEGVLRILVIGLLSICLRPFAALAQERLISQVEAPIQVTRTAASAIRIDGLLADQEWQDAVVLDLAYEIMPGENTPSPVRTSCRITYDEQNLYFAFHALDPRPSEIRARVTDRDVHQSDDAIGVFIDPFNDERRSFEFLSNPLGVQTDLSRSDVADGDGDPEDITWDAIWNSAGRLTSDGYVVEIAIPFTSLRFPRTQEAQTWGILLFRNYPRDVRHQIASVPRSQLHR
jgi:hypothetical protein